jgi:hypothetical protein
MPILGPSADPAVAGRAGRGALTREGLAALWDHCGHETRDEGRRRDDGDHDRRALRLSRPDHGQWSRPRLGAAVLRHRFIGVNPPDFTLVPVSRMVGADRVVDGFVLTFAHTTRIDGTLPEIAPTGRTVGIPMVAIVHFSDDKRAYEHIYWDRTPVLVQIGVLDPAGLPMAGAARWRSSSTGACRAKR